MGKVDKMTKQECSEEIKKELERLNLTMSKKHRELLTNYIKTSNTYYEEGEEYFLSQTFEGQGVIVRHNMYKLLELLNKEIISTYKTIKKYTYKLINKLISTYKEFLDVKVKFEEQNKKARKDIIEADNFIMERVTGLKRGKK